MSVINQMLRDLDRRHGPDSDLALAAVGGVQAQVPAARRDIAYPLIFGAGLAALILFAGLFLRQGQDPGQRTAEAVLTVHQPLSLALPPQTPHSRRSRAGATSTDAATSDRHRTQTVAAARETASAPASSASSASSASASASSLPALTALAVSAPGAFAAGTAPATAISSGAAAGKPEPLPPVARSTADPSQETATLFNQAQQSLAERQPRAARRLLTAVLAAEPAHKRARLQLSALLVARGDSAAAEAVLAAGLNLTPGDADLARRYARLLAQRNALQAALEALAPVNSSHDARTLALRAELFNRLARYGEAAKTYQAALKLDPAQALWWTGLGVALEHGGSLGAALAAYREAARYALPASVDAYVQQRIRALDAHAMPAKG